MVSMVTLKSLFNKVVVSQTVQDAPNYSLGLEKAHFSKRLRLSKSLDTTRNVGNRTINANTTVR